MRNWVLAVFILIGTSASFQTTPDTMLDAAIAQAIEQYNAREYNPFIYRELGRTMDDERGGVIYLALEDRMTGERLPDIVDWLVVVRRASRWQVFLPGDFGYRAAYDELPSAITDALDDSRYRVQYDPTLTRDELLDYQFPWEDGGWATVTRSYSDHGTGRIDFDLSGRAVATAKDGMIVYANDTNTANTYNTGAWWQWNVVIIQHDEHEYSLYGHLAPGSLASWIRESCTDDTSQPNCAVPVRAGDVIAEEGSTGYSSSPHLHVEFGQAYGVVGYANASGRVTYTGYVFAEHNVGFSGYAQTEVRAWSYGRLVQAMHHPAPADTNLIHNGSFEDGTTEWTPSGQVNWSVQDGTMRFLRLNTSEPPAWAAFYQDFGFGAPANAIFEIGFQLGNASQYPKTVSVTLLNAAGRDYGAITCDFTLGANTAMQPYIMRGQTRDTWANVRLEFSVNPPDSAPAAFVDDVSARFVNSSENIAETECGNL